MIDVLVIDNYDSFTYNLVQYLGELGAEIVVFRNDKVTVAKIEEIDPASILISPGPKDPEHAGISKDVIKSMYKKKKILGVCLGHQAIGEVFGAKVKKAKKVCHGKASLIYHNGKDIFFGIKSPFLAARYHSLVVDRDTIPDSLEIIAETEDGTVMGVRHRIFPTFGIQFHPESFLTEYGKRLLRNFLEMRFANSN